MRRRAGHPICRQAGVASVDHADQLGDETMRLMREKQIYAVPTFTIRNISPPTPARRPGRRESINCSNFTRRSFADSWHGVPMAVGSDVGPFPHGTQAREFELMVKYGMKPLDVLQADMLNGAKLLGWDHEIGAIKPGYNADIIAVPGNPWKTSAS